jgi:hypothetical protein
MMTDLFQLAQYAITTTLTPQYVRGLMVATGLSVVILGGLQLILILGSDRNPKASALGPVRSNRHSAARLES